jgi:hypothetical protein
MDFAEKGDFDAEEDEFNPADIIDEPEAENGAEGRRVRLHVTGGRLVVCWRVIEGGRRGEREVFELVVWLCIDSM